MAKRNFITDKARSLRKRFTTLIQIVKPIGRDQSHNEYLEEFYRQYHGTAMEICVDMLFKIENVKSKRKLEVWDDIAQSLRIMEEIMRYGHFQIQYRDNVIDIGKECIMDSCR